MKATARWLPVLALLLGCGGSVERSDGPARRDASLEARADGRADTRADLPRDLARVEAKVGLEAGGAGSAFGDPCTMDGAKGCGAGLLCLSPSGNQGFCSKSCDQGGQACEGAPAGTAAFCIVEEAGTPNGKKGCAFVCQEPGKTFTCPGQLKCQSYEDPAGSGQKLCLP